MKELSIKLKALKYQLQGILNTSGRYYDPQTILYLFKNFSKYQTKLKKIYPSLFDDFPLIKIPIPSETTDFDGRGYITRDKLEILLQDVKSTRILLGDGENANNPEGKLPKDPKKLYIDGGIIDRFSQKADPFNYKKLLLLIEELNFNYSRGNIYASAALVRAILDHIPPLLNYGSFESVVNNYHWSESHLKYMRDLLNFKNSGDDALHTQISEKEDHLSVEELPSRVKINTLLEECIARGGTALPTQKNTREKTPSLSSITISIVEEEGVKWANYSVGKFRTWDCFRIVLYIDNFKSNKNDYIKVSLAASSNDGVWNASNFVFVLGTHETADIRENVDFEIGDGKRETVPVFISDRGFGNADKRAMPEFDKDKLFLNMTTASGKEFAIPIKSGLIQHG